MIDLGIKTNLDAYMQAMALRQRMIPQEQAKALRDEGRLLSLRLIRITPPRSQAQGRKAIEDDMMRSIGLMESGDFDAKRINQLLRDRNYPVLNRIMQHSGSRLRFVSFSPSYHRAAQNKRKRVRKATHTRTADRSKFQAHLKQLQESVGRAKGGWARAHIKLGGKAARWISRHSDAGFLVDNADDKKTPSLLFQNASGWAGSRGGRSAPNAVIEAAMKGRAKAIAKELSILQQKGLARDLNKAQATAVKAMRT